MSRILLSLALLALFVALPATAAVPPTQGSSPAVAPAPRTLDGILPLQATASVDALSPLFAATPQAGVVGHICFQCPPPTHQCLVNNRCSCCL